MLDGRSAKSPSEENDEEADTLKKEKRARNKNFSILVLLCSLCLNCSFGWKILTFLIISWQLTLRKFPSSE